jgi:hypothetical protein
MSRKQPTRPGDRQGQTLPQQGETIDRVPRSPHERDESADSQAAGEPSAQRVGAAAHEDLAQGRRDTSKGEAMDAAYKKQQEQPASPPDKKPRV